jgi:hypothetical protein
MEVPAAVAPHDFQLAMDGFDDIGSREATTDAFRVVQEGQIVGALLTQLRHEVGVGFGKFPVEKAYRFQHGHLTLTLCGDDWSAESGGLQTQTTGFLLAAHR